jgi:hypothetical protein
MTSHFDGWTAHAIVGPLNKKEVQTALLDYGIERSSFRTWDSIEHMILNSSERVKQTLYECGEVKRNVEEQHRLATLKRRHDERSIRRIVRRRLGLYFINCDEFDFLKKWH